MLFRKLQILFTFLNQNGRLSADRKDLDHVACDIKFLETSLSTFLYYVLFILYYHYYSLLNDFLLHASKIYIWFFMQRKYYLIKVFVKRFCAETE